ncbi:hypothetical protein JOB18_049076 [Solea senegalensis]|uniref:Secreted protein n=1 Tax=Solea senegalensis TaxID=28829 RepID=A0AAV6PF14_SOLSE|nr:hypothetical protein JOB18_049076 [Solea senegalensis]
MTTLPSVSLSLSLFSAYILIYCLLDFVDSRRRRRIKPLCFFYDSFQTCSSVLSQSPHFKPVSRSPLVDPEGAAGDLEELRFVWLWEVAPPAAENTQVLASQRLS